MPTHDDFTPITNLADLGPAISDIKRGQERTADAVSNLDRVIQCDVKPKLDKVHEGFIVLETEHKVTKARVKSLEEDTKKLVSTSPQPHDCYHEDELGDLKEGQRSIVAEMINCKTDLATTSTEHKRTKEQTGKDIERIEGRSKTITGIAVTVILFVLASAGAASAAFYTTQTRVGVLVEEQSKIRDEMEQTRKASISASTKLESAATKVERMANQVKEVNVVDRDEGDPLELLWCDISPQERRRQEKLRGPDKIPQRRCP